MLIQTPRTAAARKQKSSHSHDTQAPVGKPLLKPVLKWAGGKSGLLPQLLPEFPLEFCNYYEPFFGGGAVFFALCAQNRVAQGLQFSGCAHLNDLNTELINVYATLRDFPLELMAELRSLALRYSEQFYYELRSQEALGVQLELQGQNAKPDLMVRSAARTIFLNKTGYNGLYRQNSKGLFNVPFGKRPKCPALFDEANLLAVSAVLHSTCLSARDFEQLINQAGKGDFVYCDPPYEPVSQSSSFNAYHQQGFSQDEQVRLKEACMRAAQRGARVAISNSSAPFIKELYSGCKMARIAARRAINSKGNRRGVVEELLITLNPR